MSIDQQGTDVHGSVVTDIGDRIRQRREGLEISQEELARRVGCSIKTIYRYEAGEASPRRGRVRELAELLDVTPEWLEFGIEAGDVDPHLDTSTSQLDDTVTSHDRAIFAVGPLEPELEAHLRKRLTELAYLDGGPMATLVGALEAEKAKWKAERSGMPPKVADAPDLEAKPSELTSIAGRRRKK